MELLGWLAAVVAVVAIAIAAFYPLLTDRSAVRRAAVVGLSGLLLPLPLLIPDGQPAAPLVRFLAAILCALTAGRFYDLHLGFAAHGRPPLRGYLSFMGPGLGHAVYRKLGSEPGPGRAGNLRQLAIGAPELIVGCAALYVAFALVDWTPHAFAVEHVAKWVVLYLVLDGGLRVVVALQRLAGLDALDLYRDPIVARTPADFWRRYNRLVGEWLFSNVFRRLRRRPALGCMAAFTVSALLHEYLFAVALLRLQGFQTAFFLLHGVAVVLSARLKPKGWRAGLGIALTLAFSLSTLVLFTASVDDTLRPLIPFYADGRPALWAD